MLDTANASTPPTAPPPIAPEAWEPFPEIDLRQLLRLSDDTGMFQHALYGLPDPNHGYCIDDNARAAIAALRYAELRGYDERAVPLHRYLTFLTYAFNEKTRSFRNFMSYDRRWLEEEGSQDSQGRTVWALGLTVRLAPQPNLRGLARSYLLKGLPAVEQFGHIRSWAFALLGLDEFLKAEEDDHATRLRDAFAQRLFDAWKDHATPQWPWWEDVVTYDNAKLCHALLVSGRAMGRADMVDAALASLRWLLEVQTVDDDRGPHLSIIGNDGWMRRDPRNGANHRARFDQQPLEAYAMVHACLLAAEATGDEAWAHHAWRCFEWFRGRNDLGIPLYNENTGGCRDGLMAEGVNENQGAESTLAYLLSVLELHRYRADGTRGVTVKPPQTIGYAIIGVSGFAEFCLEQYRQVEGVKPIGAWNRTASKAQALAARANLRAYDDVKALVEDPAVHLVHVATTPATHAEFALAALAAGKHVLCEKPLAIDPIDAQRMVSRAAERDRTLAPNFMMRYGPLAQPVRRLIDRELLGAPLRGAFVNRAGDAGLPPGHWFWDESQSGGIFIEHGVHAFDLAHHWLGRGALIAAHRNRRPSGGNGDAAAPAVVDQVACEVAYGHGATFSFYHGFLQPTPLDEQDFRLIFERGEVRLRGWIAVEIDLHGLVTEQEFEQLKELFPAAEVETLRRFEGEARRLSRRSRNDPLDREVRLRWADAEDKQAVYGRCLRALLEDVVQRIHNPRHRTIVDATEAVTVLNLAAEATRMAAGFTP